MTNYYEFLYSLISYLCIVVFVSIFSYINAYRDVYAIKNYGRPIPNSKARDKWHDLRLVMSGLFMFFVSLASMYFAGDILRSLGDFNVQTLNLLNDTSKSLWGIATACAVSVTVDALVFDIIQNIALKRAWNYMDTTTVYSNTLRNWIQKGDKKEEFYRTVFIIEAALFVASSILFFIIV